MQTIERSSTLAASAPEVWRHASSMRGVNLELVPIRMSYPTGMAELATPPLGTPVFTSTLWFGAIPFDRHRLTFVEWDDGTGFVEDSTSILHRRWRHHRVITPLGTGCVLTDVVDVEPRLPATEQMTGWLVTQVFDRRHAVLTTVFGAS